MLCVRVYVVWYRSEELISFGMFWLLRCGFYDANGSLMIQIEVWLLLVRVCCLGRV